MITRVWGKADSFALEFTKDENGLWTAEVPTDYEDGQYAVEIHAVNQMGYSTYWTGLLFISDGKVCLHIKPPEYIIWVQTETNYLFEALNDWIFTVEKGCKNG